MQKMMINAVERAERWNLSPKTLQRWRSAGRGPRFMKMCKRGVYPMDEVLNFESQALRTSTWESAGDVVRPSGANLMSPRKIAHVTGLPLQIFCQM
ncbi:MAG: hypothetical protein IT500_16590 [Rubrivivax sp.]|nr:hypothetical protein [Rubrivivax sp.]